MENVFLTEEQKKEKKRDDKVRNIFIMNQVTKQELKLGKEKVEKEEK